MKQITINIPDNKYAFFMELIKSIGFVDVNSEQKLYDEQLPFVDEVNESLAQVEKHLAGEIKLKTADKLLDEL